MSERVVGAIDDHQRSVAHKLAIEAGHRERLAWEAHALAAARHPGVVELLGHDDLRLTTGYVGSHSLATWSPPDLETVARLTASLATTLADLHGLGIVHGRVDPSHVLLGPDARPVLCGFSGAVVRGRSGPPTSAVVDGFADPSGAGSGPATDVYGLGAILSALVRGGGRLRPLAGRRRFLHPARPVRDLRRRGPLLRLASQATAADPRRRPTARLVASSLGHRPAPDPASRRSPGPVPAIIGATAVAAAVGGLGWMATSSARPEPRRPRAVTPDTTVVDPEPTTTQISTLGAPVVETAAGRFAVGRHGDQALLGDWDCDGVATVALLRPATGEVFVFDSWAGPHDDLTVPPAARVAGAIRAVAHDPDGDGCATVHVERVDASPVEVHG